MKNKENLLSFISHGFSTDLAEKLVLKKYTVTKLKVISKTDLKPDFFDYEIETIMDLSKRQPISEKEIVKLVNDCDWKCCFCWNFNDESPIIIHHIEEHSKTRDDSYENLILLCLNHHAIAHSKWEISRHPLPKELLRQRKLDWIKALKDFKNGLRVAPGKEDSKENVFTHTDIEAIKIFSMIFDRPAIHTPFRCEGNMNDFLQAIDDTILAFNTGILKTRSGEIFAKTKPRKLLSNPNWNDIIGVIANRLIDVKNRIRIAVINKEMILREDGFFCFYNQNLPVEIDAIRGSIILLFNGLLKETNLPLINERSIRGEIDFR